MTVINFERRCVATTTKRMRDESISIKGSFTNYVDKILAFFDHLPPSVDIFPSAIDSDSIEPLSVLHSGLKFEW